MVDAKAEQNERARLRQGLLSGFRQVGTRGMRRTQQDGFIRSVQSSFYTCYYIAIIRGSDEVERGQELRGIT